MKKILILGGTGYLGLNIACALSASNSITVTGRKSLNPNFLSLFQRENLLFEPVELINLKRIYSLIDLNEIVVFAVPNIQPHQIRPLFHSDYLKIILPAEKIFEHASTRNKRVIFLSSGGSVYGAGGQYPHAENSVPNPITKYGRYKLALDNSLLSLNTAYNSTNISLRIANPYGGTFGDTFQQGFINSAIRNFKSGNRVEIWGDGLQIRDFIYIKDLVRLVELIIADDNLSGLLNCGSGLGYTLRDVITKIETITNKRIEVKFIESYKELIKSNILSIEKAQKNLSWYPEHELQETLSNLLISKH